MAKNVTAFFPCPKNFQKAKSKSNRLISLVEDIPKQLTINCYVVLMTFTPACKRKISGEEKNYKMSSLEKKRALRNLIFPPMFVMKDIKTLRRGLIYIEIKGRCP